MYKEQTSDMFIIFNDTYVSGMMGSIDSGASLRRNIRFKRCSFSLIVKLNEHQIPIQQLQNGMKGHNDLT